MERIRIATRASNLAMWQAQRVRALLRERWPRLDVELVEISTRGDRFQAGPLSRIGGKGWFVKELEAALLEDRADIAVHSMKDVTSEFPDGLVLDIICERGDPHDALVVRGGVRATTLQALPHGARVGTSSLRRRSQLRAVRPDAVVGPVRGNVETRLSKLDAGQFDAIVLAAAGLERLGLADRMTARLGAEVCLPACGQGAIGIEYRTDDAAIRERLAPLADARTAACVRAEREVVRRLGGSCSVPLAAHAVLDDAGMLQLSALVASLDGDTVIRAARSGDAPLEVGAAVAESLLAQGAAAVLEAAIAQAEREEFGNE